MVLLPRFVLWHSTLPGERAHLFGSGQRPECSTGVRDAAATRRSSGGRIRRQRVQMLMRLTALLFTAILAATPSQAQEAQPSSATQSASPSQDDKAKKPDSSLPVSLDKIKKELEQPAAPPLRGLNERPTFKLEIHEKPKVSLDDLIKSLDFKAGPVPAGGVYAAELQRQAFPATNNPLAQPYAAFNQGELLTILVENLVGKYLAG